MKCSTTAGGLTAVTLPFGELVPRRTSPCGHCGAGIYTDAVGDGTGTVAAMCNRCWALTCPACQAKGVCAVQQKKIAEIARKSDLPLARYLPEKRKAGATPAKQKGASA